MVRVPPGLSLAFPPGSRAVVKSGPVLTTLLLFAALLTATSGRKMTDDPGPDSPWRAAGTSIFRLPTSSCAMSASVRPTPTQERLARHGNAACWSELGGTWSRLHSLMRGIRTSAALGGGRSRIVHLFATTWVVKRAAKEGSRRGRS